MSEQERLFLKYSGNSRQTKITLRNNFKQAQRIFDRKLTKMARENAYKKVSDIETSATNNHKDFWKKIKSLGPRNKTKDIPMQVRIGDHLFTEDQIVLEKWRDDFANLLNCKTEAQNHLNDNFFAQTLNHKQEMESSMLSPEHEHNVILNSEITLAEVDGAVRKLKDKKRQQG